MNALNIILGIICFGIGFAIAFWIKGRIISQKIKAAEGEASRLLADSRRKADTILREAELEIKDRLFKMKSEFDAETKETRSEQKKRESRLIDKEENIDRKIEQYERKERELNHKEKKLRKREGQIERKELEYEELIEVQKQQLEKISGLSAGQAKELLIRAMENEARYEGARIIKKIENEAKEQADRKAKKILATAIQRYAGEYVAERTVSVVQLPSDEMKGRIIGREGRNIRALEAATGRLLWRFRAAPVERHIMVYGNLCSTWPVNTGVLVKDGVAYAGAGIIDTDGTYVYALDALTGKVKWQNITSGHLDKQLRKGVSAQGILTAASISSFIFIFISIFISTSFFAASASAWAVAACCWDAEI